MSASALLAASNGQSRSAVRQHRATECVKQYREVVPHNDAKHSYEEPKLSSPAQGRTFEHCSADIKESDLAKQVASALIIDFGQYRSTHKMIARHAGASVETVKRWLAGDNLPSFVYIMRLRPHSPALRKLLTLESELSPDFQRELSDLMRRHMRG